MTGAAEVAPRRYGNFENVLLAAVADVPGVIETVAAQMREALEQRPDIRNARLIQGTVRITAFNDNADGPTHRVDWVLEVPSALVQPVTQ